MAGPDDPVLDTMTGFVLPDTPGNFTEAAPPVASGGEKPNVFTPLTPEQELKERKRLGFQAGSGLAGAASAASDKTVSTAPTFTNDQVPGIDDFSRGNSFAFSPGEQSLVSPYRAEEARKSLEDTQADALAYKSMPGFSNFNEGAVAIGSHLVGGLTSPENLFFPEIKVGSALFRATRPFFSDMLSFGLGQAVVQGVADPLKQAAEVRAGLKKEFDPVQTSLAIPIGFAFGAGITALNRGAGILYHSGIDAMAGRLTDRLPPMVAEVRPPVLPEPQRAPLVSQMEAPVTRAPVGESAASTALPAVEPPVAPGMTRLYRADAAGTADPTAGRVAFVTERGRAADTPSMGAKPAERTEVSYIDVPDNVAVAARSGEHVALPTEVAAERRALPETPAPRVAEANTDSLPPITDRAETEALRAKLDTLDVELMNTKAAARRDAIKTEIAQIEARLKPPESARTTGPEGGEVAPRLKGMAGGRTAAALPGTSRPGAGVASAHQTGEMKPVENLTGAMRRIADSLDLSVRRGTNRADSTATYNFNTQIVRLQNVGPDYFVDFSHELGHHVETAMTKKDTLGRITSQPITDLINNNVQIMRTFGGDMVVNMRNAEGVSEGFGEFMASYITKRERAESIAPGFVKAFRDTMARENPELLAVLDDAHATWARYQATPSRVAGESRIVSHTEIPTTVDPKDPLKRSPLALWMSNIYTNYVNRQHPLQIMERFLAEQFEKKYGRLLNIRPDETPSVIAQLYGRGGHQMTVMDMTYGTQNAHSLKPEGPAFFSILRRVAADPVTGGEVGDGAAAAARLKAFDTYLVDRWERSLRKQISNGTSDMTRNPTSATDGEIAVRIAEYEKLHPNFPALAEEVYAYNKLLVKKEFDANLRTRESLDEMMHPDNHEYVPLRRDMRDITEEMKGSRSLGGEKGLESLGYFARKGSDRNILSPTESIMLRNFTINDQMVENWIKIAIRDVVRLVGGKEGAAIAEEIPSSAMRAMDIDVEETLFRAAKKNGWTTTDARDVAREVLAEIGPETRVQLYRAEAIRAGNKPIIFGWDQGERFALQLPDGGFGRQLQEVIDALGPKGASSWAQSSGIVFDLLASSAGVLRAGATGTATFMAKNTVRDAFMQTLLLPEAKVLDSLSLANAFRGGKSFMQGDDFYRMYASTEGIRGGVAANTVNTTRKIGDLEKQIFGRRTAAEMQNSRAELAKEFKIAGVEGHKVLTFDNTKAALEAMEFSESAGRVGAFKAIYESNIAMGRDHRYAMFDAAQKARDFIDYSRMGSRMEVMSRLIPFLNANVQGVDKFVRTYGEALYLKAPMRTEQAIARQQELRNALVPRVVAMATFSAALTFLYMDDPVYQRIPVQLRSQYWIFRVPFLKSGTYNLADGNKVELPEGMQGAWITIPKPWEPATLFNLAERAVEFVNSGDPQQIINFIKSVRYSFSIPLDVPPILKTGQGLASNYDSFFQRPIVPQSLQGVAPHLQANDYTNKFYVTIAKMLNVAWNSKDARDWFRENIPVVGAAIGAAWSPMEAQYLMQGVFGDWPRELGGVGGIVRSLVNGEAVKIKDVPMLRAFVRDSMAGGQPMRELYNQVGQNGGRLTIAAKTYKEQIAKGDPTSAQEYFSSLDRSQRDYVVLNSVPAGPLVAAIHPLDRTANLNTAVRNVRDGLQSSNGLATLNDPSVRLKLEPGMRDVVVQAMNEMAATEARNALIVQGVAGFKGIPVVDTAPYFTMLEKIAPDVSRELSARLAAKKVMPIETVQKYWPQVQKGLRIGGEANELAASLKGIGLEAAAQGYLGGGRKSGRGASDSSGQRVKRGKVSIPAFPGGGG